MPNVTCMGCQIFFRRKASSVAKKPFCTWACFVEHGKALGVCRDSKGTEDERFWSKVRKTDGCWLWEGAVNANGYGSFAANGKPITASRYAWMKAHDASLCPTQLVCHSCDTPLCVRPDHLFIGSNADNRTDCQMKQRAKGASGEANCKAKLRWQDVDYIRNSDRSNKALAQMFSVTTSTIRSAKGGRTWKEKA